MWGMILASVLCWRRSGGYAIGVPPEARWQAVITPEIHHRGDGNASDVCATPDDV
jgi:hypothetical protein